MVKEVVEVQGGNYKGMRIGKYELGKILGEGNFGKVKFANNILTGKPFAVKILEKNKIINLKITDQIKREIVTLKVLKHPNIVRLCEKQPRCDINTRIGLRTSDPLTPLLAGAFNGTEVLASKTKIYMVLEYVHGGELFDKIASKGKLPEKEGLRLFQQLVDGISYCHDKGVFHRDLKLENILIDGKGNIKVSDFGLSALPQHFGSDGLLHTTCGSPNYVAPEILANRGYNGAKADVWSCGVILYVILTGYLPFDDRNLAVLYQKIARGDVQIPKWLSSGAQKMIKRILDPNPLTRLTIAEIKVDEWFREGYVPSNPCDDDDDNIYIDDDALSIKDAQSDGEQSARCPALINAFQLIGMSSFLDLSGFFEKEDVSERKIRFTSNLSHSELLERIVNIVTAMGCHVQKKNGKLKVVQGQKDHQNPGSLSVTADVFEIRPALYVVELRKACGDSLVYQQLCKRLSNDLGAAGSQELLTQQC